MFAALRRPNSPRRGVTLVEMLVVVALVVLMMVILVQIFQAATGAMIASRTTQELDVVLRSIDSMIRADLAGATAQMTPPNDPSRKTGYFEYGENSPADGQGEDTDDFLKFTTKAPEGQVFSGRQYLTGKTGLGATVNPSIQPITITSQLAEVIYFLRNGNLYRRVFLVAPSRSKSITASTGHGFSTSIFGLSPNIVSWQGLNDISCRPNIFNSSGVEYPQPIPNDLGDLTNRENRAFSPRFSNDYNPRDGILDDNNADGIPDYYPTLYYDGVGYQIPTSGTALDWLPNASMTSYSSVVPFPSGFTRTKTNPYDVYAFPFIYPGMYSFPNGASVSGTTVTPPTTNLGWRHGLGYNASGAVNNHAPLDVGDNLPVPTVLPTWWGFPTWRETMSIGWGDPTVIHLLTNAQTQGLRPFPPNQTYSLNSVTFLPPLTQIGTANYPPFSDKAGSASFVAYAGLPNHVWEDDLIMTNVRSFDIKAYDANAPLYNSAANGNFSAGYQDLGFGANSYLSGWSSSTLNPPFQPSNAVEPVGYGHEGRIPPIPSDFRHDPRRGFLIGDAQPGVSRLVRVFDTWSTDYTNAPDVNLYLDGSPISGKPNPVYPAFPPPYPTPLRGLQIQIRVVDPRNERSKVLTIRHDFTDKLTN